jgi:hypothetical protein
VNGRYTTYWYCIPLKITAFYNYNISTPRSPGKTKRRDLYVKGDVDMLTTANNMLMLGMTLVVLLVELRFTHLGRKIRLFSHIITTTTRRFRYPNL